MAKLNKSNAYASESADSFCGIDRTGLVGKLCEASDIHNFRILPDGSIEKREGYELIAALGAPISAITPSPYDTATVYAVSGEYVYSVSVASGHTECLGRIPVSEDGTDFFTLQGSLYLATGHDIFSIDVCGNALRAEGYVPLLGSHWSADGGEIFEPLNLLSRRARISYLLDDESYRLYTGLTVQNIDALYVNGEPTRGGSIDGKYILLPAAFPAGTQVSVCLTLPSQSDIGESEQLRSCPRAYTCKYGKARDVICFGGSEKQRIFRSRDISADSMTASMIAYPDSMPVYFPAGGYTDTVVSGGVRAVCGESDCLIVFGEQDAHRVTAQSEQRIPQTGGCSVHTAAIYNGTCVFAATSQGVISIGLRSGGGELISAPLGDVADDVFLSRAVLVYHHKHSELHISDPLDGEGRQLVYNTARRSWSVFDGIGAQIFFRLSHRIGFAADSGIFIFSPHRTTDITLGGGENVICARYVSRFSALDKPDEPKRLRRMRLACTGNGVVTVSVLDPSGLMGSLVCEPCEDTDLHLYDKPLCSGRACHVRLCLESNDAGYVRIHGVALSAIK